jgi:hypothetical protein
MHAVFLDACWCDGCGDCSCDLILVDACALTMHVLLQWLLAGLMDAVIPTAVGYVLMAVWVCITMGGCHPVRGMPLVGLVSDFVPVSC